ncbi:hemolysin family protein [Euzebya sp.]|uniref:hemolysin family protein n=1 Tax=Euzebya sp. TaxID=1971409 RepID=UPI0035147C4F
MQVVLVLVLVLLNAAFAGSEMALVSLRDSQLARLEERGRAGGTLARLARDPNQFLATIQIFITLAGFMASATAAVTLAEPLVEPLRGVLGGAAEPVSVVLVTLVLTYVTLVLGELAPKRVAMQRAEGWGLLASRPLAALATLTRPAVWLLATSTDLVVRAVGVDPDAQREQITEEELRDMVAAQPELSDTERRIIDGAFEFADRSLREILVPRTAIVALPGDSDVREASRRLAATGHTRAPVIRGDLDEVLGTVHLRALVEAEGTVEPHVQPALVLPETVGCLDALRRMQADRQQMAVVINEHGGTEGLITIEDLVEELVGEIWDEADPDVQAVVHHDDGRLSVDGAYPIHDLPDIGVDLPAGDYTTLAGLVLAELGHVPTAGEVVVASGWRIEVVEATDRTVRLVELTPDPSAPDPDSRQEGDDRTGTE